MFRISRWDDADAGYHVKLHRRHMRFEHLIGASVRVIISWNRRFRNTGFRHREIRGPAWIR